MKNFFNILLTTILWISASVFGYLTFLGVWSIITQQSDQISWLFFAISAGIFIVLIYFIGKSKDGLKHFFDNFIL